MIQTESKLTVCDNSGAREAKSGGKFGQAKRRLREIFSGERLDFFGHE